MSKPFLCIYHGNCFDGFGAAWAIRHQFPDTEFVAGIYGEPPPDVTGRHVLIVDFSYKRDVLKAMIETCASLIVLDHHVTARDDLSFLPRLVFGMRSQKACAVFDMEKSGARLAWEFAHIATPPPSLLLRIEDRDLWRFAYPDTRPVHAALSSYPFDFAVWDDLMLHRSVQDLRQEGVALDRKQLRDVEVLVAQLRRRMNIGGYDVPVANLPVTLVSDAGNLMAKGEAFAACYSDTPTGRAFSLRSIGDFDVSEIAKKYGGGGHKNAAGFRVPLGWEGEPA